MNYINLETTRLDPTTPNAQILELGVIVADPQGNELAAKNWVFPCEAPPKGTHPTVKQMYEKNGLWAECAKAQPVDPLAIANWIYRNGTGDDGPIGGSSPHFDAKWLAKHLPDVRRLFNHRVHDVSTLKQALLDAGLGLRSVEPSTHRALDDLRDSLSIVRMHHRFLTAEGRKARNRLAEEARAVDPDILCRMVDEYGAEIAPLLEAIVGVR